MGESGMNIEKSTLKVGLEKPLKILHVTDNHLPLYDENDSPAIVEKGKKRNQEAALAALREEMAYGTEYVKPQPPYHDDTILMSKKFMSAVWSWDHCFNALAVGRNDPVLGMNQLLCPFYLQQEDGSLSGSFRTGQRAVGLLQAPGARLVHDEADGLARIR